MPDDKDAGLFPRRFSLRFIMLHRPIVAGGSSIWMSLTPDLKHWGDHRILVKPRPNSWDCHGVGLGPPPFETAEGWLVFYYGVQKTLEGYIYRVGAFLLDKDEPWRVIRRTTGWLMEPCETYEQASDIGGVIYPTGGVYDTKKGHIYLYYGAGARCVGAAIGNMSEILDYLRLEGR